MSKGHSLDASVDFGQASSFVFALRDSTHTHMSVVTTLPSLTLEGAQIATAAAIKKAQDLKLQGMCIAIVDATNTLLHFARYANGKLTSVDIACNKAITACGHQTGTHAYKENVWPGGVKFFIL